MEARKRDAMACSAVSMGHNPSGVVIGSEAAAAGWMVDPFERTWLISTRIEERSVEEMQTRFDEMCAGTLAIPRQTMHFWNRRLRRFAQIGFSEG